VHDKERRKERHQEKRQIKGKGGEESAHGEVGGNGLNVDALSRDFPLSQIRLPHHLKDEHVKLHPDTRQNADRKERPARSLVAEDGDQREINGCAAGEHVTRGKAGEHARKGHPEAGEQRADKGQTREQSAHQERKNDNSGVGERLKLERTAGILEPGETERKGG